MEHSKVIDALKGLPRWQFVLLWIWLMSIVLAPSAVGIAWALAK